MKYRFAILLLFLCFFACKKDEESGQTVVLPPRPTAFHAITGYNVRWRDFADFDNSNLIPLVKQLNPKLLRYPGGTLAHRWNWQTGISSESGGANDIPHPISDVKRLADATDSKTIFVLDIMGRTIADQIDMLTASNLPIEYIELGNELYSDDYVMIFPNGKSYADTVNVWTPVLKQKFPNAKIGAVMIGRTAGNDRKNFWNTEVHQNITADVDAYIYHIYVGETETVDERMTRFYERFLENTGKELWITEYGAHSQDVNQAIELAEKIDSIADIALNHCVVSSSGNFSKLTEDCNQLTEEGKAFVKRYGQ